MMSVEEFNEKIRKSRLVNKTLEAVLAELENAQSNFAPYNSPHEAYAVILEELDEFWEAVKEQKKHKGRITLKEERELIQVAVTAIRAILDLGGHEE